MSHTVDIMIVKNIHTNNERYYEHKRNYHTQSYTPPKYWVRISKDNYRDLDLNNGGKCNLLTECTADHIRQYESIILDKSHYI